ncbi:hypothetical protein OIE13_07770 [Streptosporangium sp. NBC_01810]|uniref:hypothetical protein n=1 Tax=Streptosporangium sp. NBC_01810 TaxID=2975951 RepID=UPI002DDA04F4|nr:hypothetical protein [Streptosporangium sp. NBC_01810]WSA27758.1 hypothetical protein OIE13_07770 [Streptosporangium sp. NBC_01810]
MHAVQRTLHPDPQVGARFEPPPLLQQPVERTEQEVPRPAGGVDQLQFRQIETFQGRGEGLVEDELLHEDRRLQQRVLLLDVLREILVEVAEEAGVQALAVEVVREPDAVAVPALESLDQRLGPVSRDVPPPDEVGVSWPCDGRSF